MMSQHIAIIHVKEELKMNKKNFALFALLGGLLISGCGNTSSTGTSSSSFSSESSSTSSSSIVEVTPPKEDNRENVIYCSLPYVNKSESIDISVSLKNCFEVNVRIKSENNLTLTYKIGQEESVSLQNGVKKDNTINFSFEIEDILLINQDITIKISDNESITLNLQDYFYNLFDVDLGDFFTNKALEATLISVINYIGLMQQYNGIEEDKLFNKDLTDNQKQLLYSSLSQNIYHVDWGNRDNLTITGENKEGFSWKYARLNVENDISLQYIFALNRDVNSLIARYEINDEVIETEVYKLDQSLQTEQGMTLYGFKTDSVSPMEYQETISATIYEGENVISNEAGFSITRAIAYKDIYGSDVEKKLANALYSYAKSITWFGTPEVSYDVLPAVNDNGIATCEIGEFTYDDARMLETTKYSAFGTYLYTSDNICDSNNAVIDNETYKIEYANNKFTITLNNAKLDGIMVRHGADLEIIVKGDSKISGSLYRSWDDKNAKISGSIISDSQNIVIKCENDAKLTINGSIYAPNNLVLDNANIEINTHKSGCDAIFAGTNLNIDRSNIKNNFIGVRTANNAGIESKGNVTITNSSLEVNDFDQGIFLNDDINLENAITDKIISVLGDSDVKIKTNLYGINSHTINHEMLFEGENVYIESGTGINYGNVTIGECNFECIANAGYTIQASQPVTFKTISEDYKKGIIKLVNNTPYNQWYDVNYVLKVKNMDINGGTLYLSGNSRMGVIQTESGATLNFANCDTYITSLNDGNGIRAEQLNEVITVFNTARLIIKDVDIPVACWAQPNENGVPVSLYIYGDMVVDSFRGAIGEWGDTTSIKEGGIRYTNRRSI